MPAAPKPATIPHWGDLAAWATGTFYALGQRVVANGNVYQVTTQGTSAGAGTGPSGGGGAIADNTVVWAFQAAVSTAWAPSTAYTLGDVVSNDGGKLYIALNNLSSGAGPGPTGTGGVIGEGPGLQLWSYTGTVLGQRTAPTARTADAGFVPGGPFFSQYINYFFFWVIAWLYYLRDFTDNAITWAATQTFRRLELQSDLFSTVTPTLAAKDASGNIKFIIDHNGYPLGRRNELREDWLQMTTAGASVPIGGVRTYWTVDGSGSGTCEYGTPNSSVGHAMTTYIQLSPSTTASHSIQLGTLSQLTPPIPADFAAVLEWELSLNAVGANGFGVRFGISDDLDINAAMDWVSFDKASTDTNWQVTFGDAMAGPGAGTNTGIPPVANTAQRFRLELFGSSAPGGRRVRAFINETVVLNSTAAELPATSNMRIAFNIVVSTGGTTARAYLGPVLATWSRFLSTPNL